MCPPQRLLCPSLFILPNARQLPRILTLPPAPPFPHLASTPRGCGWAAATLACTHTRDKMPLNPSIAILTSQVCQLLRSSLLLSLPPSLSLFPSPSLRPAPPLSPFPYCRELQRHDCSSFDCCLVIQQSEMDNTNEAKRKLEDQAAIDDYSKAGSYTRFYFSSTLSCFTPEPTEGIALQYSDCSRVAEVKLK